MLLTVEPSDTFELWREILQIYVLWSNAMTEVYNHFKFYMLCVVSLIAHFFIFCALLYL